MKKIIECVPNFSEGRDISIIKQITNSIKEIDDVVLLNVDSGRDTNRTVVTFAGEPQAVLKATVAAVVKATELIDMSKHKGTHPRLGAIDVCPLIPVSNVSMYECIKLAKDLGKRINQATNIPIYLYAEAAQHEDRYRLPDIRKGEYEALQEKLKDASFVPDIGEPIFIPRSGATCVGAREYMLAYNINLNTNDVKTAKDIAAIVRSSGRAKRDENGNILHDSNGQIIKLPGKLKDCQARGWFIEEYGYAQVSTNLHHINITGLHTVFDAVSKEAAKKGLRVTGSELIGLVPIRAMLNAGIYYLEKQDQPTTCSQTDIILAAIDSLGLNDTSPFDPQERIIELALEKNNTLCIIAKHR